MSASIKRLLASGLLAAIVGMVGLANVNRFRTILLLGLNSADWLILLVFAGLLAVLGGLAVLGARIAAARPKLSFLCGAIVVGGVLLLAPAGYFLWVVSGVHDRTEVQLADGRSVVVTQNCWLHCDIEISQRDGIFVDPLQGRGVTEGHIPLPKSVTVNGDELTLALDGANSLTVTLR